MEAELVAYLEREGYHPRSSRPSDFQSQIIIQDLVARCPAVARRAQSGELVAKLRHHQQVGHANWVIDIAIGSCAGTPVPLAGASGAQTSVIRMAPPVIIQIAIELKSIWTEHGKARRNRLRDVNSFHAYAHQYSDSTVAAAFVVVNSSEYFWSPLRAVNDITRHGTARRSARALARETVDQFRSVPLREQPGAGSGLEALGVVVVEHDNLAHHPEAAEHHDLHVPTRSAPVPPSPAIGDPLHYETMIQRICNAYTRRFA